MKPGFYRGQVIEQELAIPQPQGIQFPSFGMGAAMRELRIGNSHTQTPRKTISPSPLSTHIKLHNPSPPPQKIMFNEWSVKEIGFGRGCVR